jgi:hypothetical protein
MCERDDEDLALEQVEPSRSEPEEGRQASGHADVDVISPARARFYELDRRINAIHEQRNQLPIEDAETIRRVDHMTASIEHEHQRDSRPNGWRDRGAHKIRKRERERHLEELRGRRAELIDRVPNPDAVLDRADELQRDAMNLGAERRRVRDRAIAEELAAQPAWLERTLGRVPTDRHQRERWDRAAREITAHRIDHGITDQHIAVDPGAKDHALARSIAATRAALGLDARGGDRDLGLDY